MRVILRIFGVIVYDLREMGEPNQKMLVHSLEEHKKIGEVGFRSLSVGAIVSEKIAFF